MFKAHYYKKVWGSIGFVVNLSQMIEYNLANILAINEVLTAFDEKGSMFAFEYNKLVEKTEEWYERLDKKELGRILEDANKKQVFSEEFINHMDEIRKERNYFVHNVFKEDLFTKEFQNNPKRLIPRLQKLVGEMHLINEKLVVLSSKMKEELKLIY